jgi:serine phosphatase RsbU (regulator of sigma subunit)
MAGAAEGSAGRRAGSPLFNIAVVVGIGVLITALLSWGAASLHDSNENRLLRQRVREVATVVTAAIPSLQTPLASAAVLAEATNGNPEQFRRLMAPIVAARTPFISVSLWPTGGTAPRPLVVVGAPPELASEPPSAIRKFLDKALGSKTISIEDLLEGPDRRLGYAFSAPSPQVAKFVVYGEAALPRQRRAAVDKNSAFADLGYALYLGRSIDTQSLLASSTGGALLHGRRASVTVPFGDSHLLVVMTPRQELGGTLPARLWWTLGLLGLVITAGAALLVGRLSRRRQEAESLAGANARLYAEQRSVAQTLQHSLLAEDFPKRPDLEFAAKYVAGVEGIDIGGDWYDVVQVDENHVLVIVGDVSGRGLDAATMMASMRFGARAFATVGFSPAEILTRLSGLASIRQQGHFSTVLCGVLDVPAGRITFANAGHPAPLLIGSDQSDFVDTNVGVPVAVDSAVPYSETVVGFTRGETLLLFTDGAVERRGETLDVGMRRLKDASASVNGSSLDEFVAEIASAVIADGAEDDTAILAVRWRT